MCIRDRSPLFEHIFRCTESRFSHFEARFWRTVWTKNSEKTPFVHLSRTYHLSCYSSKSVACNSQNRVLYHFKSVKIAFFSLCTSLLAQNMDEKFCKKFQMFLVITSIDGVSFKIFHPKHHTWKINNQIAKNGNFEPLYLGNPLWSQHGSISITIYRSHFGCLNFFFVTQC